MYKKYRNDIIDLLIILCSAFLFSILFRMNSYIDTLPSQSETMEFLGGIFTLAAAIIGWNQFILENERKDRKKNKQKKK